MFGSRRRRALVVVAAAFALATAACSSSGGAASQSGAAANGLPRLTFAMISHAPEGDAFFDVIRKGAQDAAAKDNVEFKYSSSGQIPDQSTFIQNAIDSKVDGIAVSLPDATALGPVVRKAVAAGIPVVAFNAGDRDWQKTGALAFYGEPEVLAGEFAGTKLNEIGSKHALCVLQAQGQVQLEDRCSGIASKFRGTTEKLYAQGTDTPQYVSTISSKLQQDPTIDAVVTLGPALGVAVQRQLEQTGSTAKVVTYAFNNDLIPLLQNGKVAFTIDQQPYLQGYLSIDSLWLYHKNKSVIGAQQSVPTGPVVIDQSNIGNILDAVKAGLR
ncbi:MAG: simple sugar transport system substrate-binding protein [Pseudonocardiales bacterium]|jgi:simple sugar transport system substrate-binding protein|nr:simple sugar transport system substrate-binding protein [Pseudonocardiales bacterium]MDT7692005.1 simple sugar transport system substrate-binding protein [Pseudonocardiales bacterium]